MTLTKFIRASAVTVGALAVATQVNAADLYSGGGLKDTPVYAPAPMWTGFYFGTHLGADWAGVNVNRLTDIDDTDGMGNGIGGGSLKSSGAFGGGQLGYNWQTSNFVLGLEVDLGAFGNSSERTFSAKDGGLWTTYSKLTIQEKTGFYGDVTGRLGYALGPTLLYAKGGFAWLDTKFRNSGAVYDVFPGVDITERTDVNKMLTGWTVGGGMEYMLAPNWTVKVEYLHFDFSNCDDMLKDDDEKIKVLSGNLKVDSVKLGVNYLLNRGYAPLK